MANITKPKTENAFHAFSDGLLMAKIQQKWCFI